MVAKPLPPTGTPNETGAATDLQEALARMKSATERHAALVGVLTRLGVSAQDKRLAQAESKKVERELREAQRVLSEVQASAGKP